MIYPDLHTLSLHDAHPIAKGALHELPLERPQLQPLARPRALRDAQGFEEADRLRAVLHRGPPISHSAQRNLPQPVPATDGFGGICTGLLASVRAAVSAGGWWASVEAKVAVWRVLGVT